MAAVILTFYFPYKGIARQHEPCKDFHFMKNEIWKDIIGYEGYYQISNEGRVRSVDRIANNQYGAFFKTYCIGLQKPQRGMDNVCSKPILMCSMSGVVLKKYISLTEAAKENNLRQGSISNVLIGNSKSLHGLIFKYA